MRHTRTRKIAIAAMALVVTLVQAGSSFAAGESDLVKEGKLLVREGRWQELYDKFRAAYSSYPDPQYLLWMGLAKSQLGGLLEARELYEQARKEALQGKLESDASKAEEALEEISERIPRIKLHLPSDVGPVGISVDGSRVELVDGSVRVNPGHHRVVVSAPARESFRAVVAAGEGDLLELEVELVPENLVPTLKMDAKSIPVQAKSANTSRTSLAVFAGVGGGVSLIGLVVAISAGDNVQQTTVGATMACVGGAFALASGVWLIASWPRNEPGVPKKKGKAMVGWAIAPVPGGAWGGVGGRF